MLLLHSLSIPVWADGIHSHWDVGITPPTWTPTFSLAENTPGLNNGYEGFLHYVLCPNQWKERLLLTGNWLFACVSLLAVCNKRWHEEGLTGRKLHWRRCTNALFIFGYFYDKSMCVITVKVTYRGGRKVRLFLRIQTCSCPSFCCSVNELYVDDPDKDSGGKIDVSLNVSLPNLHCDCEYIHDSLFLCKLLSVCFLFHSKFE